MAIKDITQLGSELKRTNDMLSKRVSFRHMFMVGLVQGFASAIGATIVAGVAIAYLIRVAERVNLPYIEQYIP